MIKTFSFLFVSAFFIVACRSKGNEKQLQAVIEGFRNSNQLVEENIGRYLESMDAMTKDPYAQLSAQPAFEKAKELFRLSNQVRQYINTIRNKADDHSAFIPQLFDTLFACKRSMIKSLEPRDSFHLKIFKHSTSELINSLPLFRGKSIIGNDSITAFKATWMKTNFADNSELMDELILSKIENDLLLSTNRLINYCFNSFSVHGPCYTYFPMTSINSSYVKTGDKIEITVGVGAFVASVKPKILFDGKPMVLDPEGVAVYTAKANGKPGKRSLRIDVEYTKPDGTIERVFKNLAYTVLP